MKESIYPNDAVVYVQSGGGGHHEGRHFPNGSVVHMYSGGNGHHEGRHLP